MAKRPKWINIWNEVTLLKLGRPFWPGSWSGLLLNWSANCKAQISNPWSLNILLSINAMSILFLFIFPTSPLIPLGFKPLSLLLSISGTRSITLVLEIRCQIKIQFRSKLLHEQLFIPIKIHLIDLHSSSPGSVERLNICGRLSHLQK